MGYSSYSTDSRDIKYKKLATETNTSYFVGASGSASLDMRDAKAFNAIFTQNKERRIHQDMNPKDIKFRECFDSVAHPNTVPIIVALDVTGSMGNVPKDFVMDGLPTMMSTIIQRGTPDASICFMAIGDHECDQAPIQIGQFESGDAELDLWLTRSWLEGGGGGNNGESYALAWYAAARHTKTDACTKRSTKGFLFTVGDEPNLSSYPASALKALFGDGETVQGSLTAAEILKEAQVCYNVYHIALSPRDEKTWKALLGQNYIPCSDYREVPKMIAEIVAQYTPAGAYTPQTNSTTPVAPATPIDTTIIL